MMTMVAFDVPSGGFQAKKEIRQQFKVERKIRKAQTKISMGETEGQWHLLAWPR
jgi:hypothetical protein